MFLTQMYLYHLPFTALVRSISSAKAKGWDEVRRPSDDVASAYAQTAAFPPQSAHSIDDRPAEISFAHLHTHPNVEQGSVAEGSSVAKQLLADDMIEQAARCCTATPDVLEVPLSPHRVQTMLGASPATPRISGEHNILTSQEVAPELQTGLFSKGAEKVEDPEKAREVDGSISQDQQQKPVSEDVEKQARAEAGEEEPEEKDTLLVYYTYTSLGMLGNANRPYQVDFDGPDDPLCALNWPDHKKWAVTLLCSLSGLITLMSGTMMAPALNNIAIDLDLDTASANLALSIYVLAYAFGPLFLAPSTEIYGRRPVWLFCGIIYLVFNTVSGFAQNKATMIACRFLAGIGASVEFAVGPPTSPTVHARLSDFTIGHEPYSRRLLETGAKRTFTCDIHLHTLARNSHRSHHWRSDYTKYWLALALLGSVHFQRPHHHCRRLPLRRAICSKDPSAQSESFTQGLRKRLLRRAGAVHTDAMADTQDHPDTAHASPLHPANFAGHVHLHGLQFRHQLHHVRDICRAVDPTLRAVCLPLRPQLHCSCYWQHNSRTGWRTGH